MASIIKLVVSNYNEFLETSRDPVIDSWLFMDSPIPMITIVIAYLTFVLKIGPKMMEKRPAYELKTVIILYNAFQVIFNFWLANQVPVSEVLGLVMTDTCNGKVPVNKRLQSMTSTAAWWYFSAKITELLDTVFFILRKKFNQVSFLHVYHHTIMAFFSWCYLKFLPAEQVVIIGLLNSSVHVIMYSYYMIAALGPDYRKYIWWKKYMTWVQLTQFILMLSYLLFVLSTDCRTPKALIYFFMTNVIIFMYLFTDFYRKSYVKPKKT